jgi:type III secretory pathway component EscR
LVAGIYISLFLLTFYLLFRRRKSPGIKLLIVISCIMAALGTTQMAVNIAETAVVARFVQQIVHAQVLNEHESLSSLAVLETIGGVLFSINK